MPVKNKDMNNIKRSESNIIISMFVFLLLFFGVVYDTSPHVNNYTKFTINSVHMIKDKNTVTDSQYWINRNHSHNGFMVKGDKDLVDIFRGTCYAYISQPNICSHIYFKVMDTKSFSSFATTYYRVGKNYSSVDGIVINSLLKKLSIRDIKWVAYHELSHVEVFTTIHNSEQEHFVISRGSKVFESNVPMEVLADCMVLSMAKLNYSVNNVPYYFTTINDYTRKDMRSVCSRWHYVLYGK